MTEDGSNGAADSGNTKRVSPSKRWVFTFNNYSNKEFEAIRQLLKNGSNYIIGKEVGASGTSHLQGYVEFHKKVRPISLFKDLSNKIHWEKARGSQKDNILYCSKDNNFVLEGLKVPRPLKLINDLFPWQEKCEAMLSLEPDERIIYWIYDEAGNCGKSAFAKRLCATKGAVVVEGKNKDILYCAAEFESDIYLFDFPRSMEGNVNYGAIEKIKNGLYMSSKYESKPIIRNSPHIVIFSNFLPDVDKLSKDRWRIYHINPIDKNWEHVVDFGYDD